MSHLSKKGVVGQPETTKKQPSTLSITMGGRPAYGRPLTAAPPIPRRPPTAPHRPRSSGMAHAIAGPEGLRLGRLPPAPVQPVRPWRCCSWVCMGIMVQEASPTLSIIMGTIIVLHTTCRFDATSKGADAIVEW